LLSGNITDPQNSNRAAGEQFVMTAHPDRPVRYPVIIVQQNAFNSQQTGIQDTNSLTTVDVNIDIYTKSTEQRDSLAGSTFAVLEQNWEITSASGLHDFRFYNMQNTGQPGPAGIYRKTMMARFNWPPQ